MSNPPDYKSKPSAERKTNPRVSTSQQPSTAPADAAPRATTYGKHATMPVLASDLYAEVCLPDLLEFDPEEIKLDATIVAIGKRRTGKSWLLRNIMYLMRDKIPAGIVISQTDELNMFWRQYVPSKYIYPKYEPEILDAVFKRQKNILQDNSLTDEEKDKKAPFFVLLDDVISDQRLKYDENLMELFVAGRHYRLFVMITSQYAKAITPTLRGNTDYAFLMKCAQQRQREALWEDFADALTKDAFAQMLDAYTEDNEVLVVDTSPEKKVDPIELFAWWKAVDPGEFAMGSKEYWQSAMSGEGSDIPPQEGPGSYSRLMTVDDIMPAPFNQMV